MSVGDGPRTGDEKRQVDQDAPFLPDASTTSGLKPAGRVRTPGTGSQPVTGDLRLELASVIHEAGCQCRGHTLGWTIRDRDAQQLAQGVLDAGYRLVVDDGTTAEISALAKTLEASRDHARRARREGLDDETCRFWSGVSGFLRSRIRALEAGEEPDWPDAANSAAADLSEDDDPARAAVRALREDTADD